MLVAVAATDVMAAASGASSASASASAGSAGSAHKPWHRQDGKGFVNPWPSFIDHGITSIPRMLMDWDSKK